MSLKFNSSRLNALFVNSLHPNVTSDEFFLKKLFALMTTDCDFTTTISFL